MMTNLKKVYKKIVVWLLTSLHYTSQRRVSSWTGFSILVRDEVNVFENVVGYLSTTNGPSTNLAAVQEMLRQSQKIKKFSWS